jgi:hypothetical protein
MVKPFSRELYTENDVKAKSELRVFLSQLGYDITDKDAGRELFKKGDIFVYDSKQNPILVETEIKKVWIKEDGWETKWTTIHVPFRKKSSEAMYHVMFNFNLTALAMIEMSKIKQAEVVTKNTRYTTAEQFFSLPYQDFNFYHKIENTWVKLRRVI